MFKVEVKVKEKATDNTKYYNYDYCNLDNLDGLMHDITKHIRRELKYVDLYERITKQYYTLAAANITPKVLFLTPEAADYMKQEYGWLNEKGKIAQFEGSPVYIIPELEQDFFMGVTNG